MQEDRVSFIQCMTSELFEAVAANAVRAFFSVSVLPSSLICTVCVCVGASATGVGHICWIETYLNVVIYVYN